MPKPITGLTTPEAALRPLRLRLCQRQLPLRQLPLRQLHARAWEWKASWARRRRRLLRRPLRPSRPAGAVARWAAVVAGPNRFTRPLWICRRSRRKRAGLSRSRQAGAWRLDRKRSPPVRRCCITRCRPTTRPPCNEPSRACGWASFRLKAAPPHCWPSKKDYRHGRSRSPGSRGRPACQRWSEYRGTRALGACPGITW